MRGAVLKAVMQALKNINLKYRFAALFGIGAFLVSFLTGIISGIAAGTVIARSLVVLPLFAFFGFAVIYVIKRYVPEFYEFINGIQESAGREERNGPVENPEDAEIDREPDERETMADSGEELPEIGEAAVDSQEGAPGSADGTNPEGEFSELKGDDYPSIETITDGDLEAPIQHSKKQLGKHIIIEEQFIKYEPKIMAEAVRTMMSKDED